VLNTGALPDFCEVGMSQIATLVQIGQLLTRSGLLSDDDLAGALIRSRERGLPIGTVLLTMGCLRQGELRAAVEAQSMVNDGLINADLAATALAQAAGAGTSFEQALTHLGYQTKTATSHTNRLGELLIDAGYIDEEHLAECLTMSMDTGMPLGRVLAFKRSVADDLLIAGLKAQRMIREGSITRDAGLQVLKAVKENKVSIEQSLVDSGLFKVKPKRSTPVGYLLVEAGFLDEVNLMTCVELSLTQGKTIVDVLVSEGYTLSALAKACLAIQQLIDHGTLQKDLGVQALRLMDTRGYSQERAVAAAGLPPCDENRKLLMQELFILSGQAEPKDIAPISAHDYAEFDEFAAILNDAVHITDCMVEAMARSLYLIDIKILMIEDAVMALHYARRSGVSVDESLTAMGWKPPIR
jgi:hypothetical protein